MNLKILKTKIENILNGEISAAQFCSWYEDWFYDTESVLKVEKKTYRLMEDLYSAVAQYVPDENVRKGHYSYIGEEELVKEIKKLYKALSKLEDQVESK